MHNLIIDVGASNLYFSKILAKKNINCKVLAIDPLIQKETKTENLHTYNCAIDINEGIKAFNISGNHGDCSSLLEPKILKKDKTIDVTCKKLINLVDNYDFNFIEYLQIDTQGNDLNVILSLEKKIKNVIYGNIEAPINKYESIYKNQYDLFEALRFLNDYNFQVDQVIPNNRECSEFNIFFSNKNIEKTNFNYLKYTVDGFNNFKKLDCSIYSKTYELYVKFKDLYSK